MGSKRSRFFERKGGAVARFWTKVYKTPSCWLWTASTEGGYGRFWLGSKLVAAHRAAWALFCGSIPDGQMVLHRCDEPSCVNPDHLFLGTQHDNMRDCRDKGRLNPGRVRGEAHGSAKLSPEDVRDIRSLAELGWTQREVGKAYGVSQQQVGRIVRRELWANSV